MTIDYATAFSRNLSHGFFKFLNRQRYFPGSSNILERLDKYKFPRLQNIQLYGNSLRFSC